MKEGDVLVDTKACALNFKDLAVILDIIPDKNIGFECSGIVIESKSKQFKKGDKVSGTDPTGNCTRE